MKLLQCLCSYFYSLQSLVNFARCRPTLSAITKKPASLAGFLYLRLIMTSFTALFLLPPRASHIPCSLQLFMQTPSSL